MTIIIYTDIIAPQESVGRLVTPCQCPRGPRGSLGQLTSSSRSKHWLDLLLLLLLLLLHH